MPLHLAQAVVDFLPTIFTGTDNGTLNEHLLEACLLFIQAFPNSVETRVKVGLQPSLMAMVLSILSIHT